MFEEIHILALNRYVKEFIMPELSMVTALLEQLDCTSRISLRGGVILFGWFGDFILIWF